MDGNERETERNSANDDENETTLSRKLGVMKELPLHEGKS